MSCCTKCAHAQVKGEMKIGSSCQPCEGGACPSPSGAGIPECVPLKWMSDRVDAALLRAIESGERDIDRLVAYVLSQVYTNLPNFGPIPWAELSQRDATCLHELRERVRARSVAVLAGLDDKAAQQRYQAVVAVAAQQAAAKPGMPGATATADTSASFTRTASRRNARGFGRVTGG